ncbi:ComEC/Rec2 family competence protein [Rothia nasisuis]|uniref:ComEC/Rec2 family competence protein n=1 Tax=Rothia nasisuis TaxID=2109647 RepID=UPI001F37B6B8|nr:ComEC/Rec2 family competence protein [Rothia nasisuis]
MSPLTGLSFRWRKAHHALLRRWHSAQEKAEHRRLQPRHLDARLLIPVGCAWVLTSLWILCGVVSTLMVVICLVLACALACSISLLRPAGSPEWLRTLAQNTVSISLLALLLCSLQGVNITARGYSSQWQTLTNLNGQGVRIKGSVVDSELAPLGGHLTTVKTEGISHRGHDYSLTVTVHVYTDSLVTPGTQISGTGTLQASGTYYRLKGNIHLVAPPDREPAAFSLKRQVRENAVARIGPDSAGLLLGMGYGDDSSLSPEALTSLRAAGLTHLTAVSGSNITLIFVLIYRTLYPLVSRRSMLILFSLAATGVYALLVGPDGSVVRAWTMGVLGALGMVLGHGTYRTALLATCVVALVILSPPLATSFGFVLSVVATASLLILAPAISRLFSHRLPLLLSDLVAMPLAASLWCAPVVLLLSDSLYPYTVLANVLAAPWVAPVTLFGLAVLVATALGFPEGMIMFLCELGALGGRAVQSVADFCWGLPASQLALQTNPATLTATGLVVAGLTVALLIYDHRVNGQKHYRRPQLMTVQGGESL